MKFLILSLTLFCFNFAHSQGLPLYYGNDFLKSYQEHTLTNEELRAQLFLILKGGHIKNNNAPDTIYQSCSAALLSPEALPATGVEAGLTTPPVKCVEHQALGYDKARRKLFGNLYLKTLENNIFSVTDVYCEKQFTDKDFGGKLTFGPDLIPSSGNIINTEHTWPQSRFTGRFDKEMQKSDLHHLFPTDSEMNSLRSSLRFGVVQHEMETLRCPQNHLGQQAEGGVVFEPPNAHKGNVARALFYFATRYQMKISPSEETYLRKWNTEDPVDAAEIENNNKIESMQGNRNPYVDFSDLINRIDRFQ